jgi:HlyD family secretion protein
MLRIRHASYSGQIRLGMGRTVLLLLGAGVALTSCGVLPEREAQAQQEQGQRGNGAVAVETAIARAGSLTSQLEYTGTTEPVRQVSLRSQVEGQLLDLAVDVGDRVRQGQVLARVDDRILLTDVNQARAELAALRSEVAESEAQVSDAEALVRSAQAELEQARADAQRFETLAENEAITAQQAEQARTTLRTAEEAVQSAWQQVRTRQQTVVAAVGRVRAQEAVLAQVEERRTYAVLRSPINGAVLEKVTEPGNLVQPGNEVLKLGNFNEVKVVVQVSELELADLRVGQTAMVKLDALPDQELSGRVTRISPAADPTARLVPIEVTIPNVEGRIGSGLLVRVQFSSGTAQPQVVVPESAIGEGDAPTLFVVQGEGEQAKAVARSVQVGDRANGQVVILSGLEAGETFIASSSRPLKDGQPVRLSILSETAPN